MQYLPSELISKTLRYNNQSNISRELSKGLYEASELDYMESICSGPINENEIQKYMKNKITFGFVTMDDYNATNMIIMTYVGDSFYEYQSYLAISILIRESRLYVMKINDYQNSFNSSRFYPPDIKIYDLITTYRIMKTRITCITINSTFAKTYTSNFFKGLINEWDNFENLIYLYTYLYINMRIMNLPIDGPSPVYNLAPADKNIILQTINDRYEPFISKMIDDINMYLDKFMI